MVVAQPFLKHGNWAPDEQTSRQRLSAGSVRYQLPTGRTAAHYLHQIDDTVHVLAGSHQRLEQQMLELGPQRRIWAVHDVDEFGRQLERRLLEACGR